MEQNFRSFYAAHVAEVQKRWEQALEAEGFSAAVVHSGTPMYSFLDDYE
ncbi:Xaa-Pro dipeptidase, partial [Pseudomonadota bacterium]